MLISLSIQTLIIIILVTFIIGVLVGVDHGKPGMRS